MKRTGYDALVLHGAADRPTGLLIDDGAVTFFDAAPEWGLTTDKATDALEGPLRQRSRGRGDRAGRRERGTLRQHRQLPYLTRPRAWGWAP